MLKDALEAGRRAIEGNLPGARMGLGELPSTEESQRAGKEARQELPRSSQFSWQPQATRPDPVELLAGQGASRVKELLPLRYGRMAASPFAFFRGGALIMASDLAQMPHTGFVVQACGDAHLSNFGAFAAPDRRLVFDINDFDETLPGYWEWDLARLAASIEICGRTYGHRPDQRREAVIAAAARYRDAMRSFSEMGNLDVWYARADVDQLETVLAERGMKKDLRLLDQAKRRGMKKDNAAAVAKLTHVEDGRLRITSNPPKVYTIEDLFPEAGARDRFSKMIAAILAQYRRSLAPDMRVLLDSYHYQDCGQKIVGVGSVGLQSWIVVLEGSSAGDQIVLQIKEAQESVLERFTKPSIYLNHGQRVVQGQRLMQAASDPFLGWVGAGVGEGRREYYVRQLWDKKTSVDLTDIKPEPLRHLSLLCAWTLARAHARASNRFAIASYLGKGDAICEQLADFAKAYADQEERDFERFTAAIKSGALPAAEG